MKTIYYLIALVMLTLGMIIFAVGNAQAGGPWIDQYCDVETTQIRVIDQQGNIVESKIEEKVVCNDGASDFLEGMGIAESCDMFTWDMPLGETLVTQRQIACEKMDGTGYEIVQGYHSIE
jgi:hypothetical protein